MRTLLLNPPSFEGFDGGAGSRWPATREIESYWYPVWLCYPAGMLPDSKVVDAPPHKVSIEQCVDMAGDFEFLVLFTSTPGLHVDLKIAERMKDKNPKLKIAFVGPPVAVEPDKVLGASAAIDFVVRGEFDYQVVEFAQGKPAAELPGASYRKNGELRAQPGRAVHRESGRAALGDQSLPAGPGHQPLQRALPAASLPGLLYVARLSGDVHLLPVAADALRSSLAAALGRRRRRRGALRARHLPGPAGDLLRRRYVQLPEGAHAGGVRQAEAAQVHLVLHFAGDHRLRDAEGHEGGRLPADDRRLRVRRPTDPQEHQEGRDRGDGAALHRERPQARPDDPRRFHRGPAGRDPGEPERARSSSPSGWTSRRSRSRSRIPTRGRSSTTTSSGTA